MKTKGNGLYYAALLAVFSIWGSLYVVSKFVLGRIPAFTVIFLRSLIAAIALLGYLRLRCIGVPVARGDRRYFVLAGVGGYFLSVGLQTLGTKYASPSMASLLNSLNPLVISVMSALILGEKLTLRKICGIAVAIAGVYLILGGVGGGSELAGILCSLTSVLIWSFVSTMNKRLTRRYPSLQITAYGVALAAVLNLIPAAWEWKNQTILWDAPSVLAVLYMGLCCTGVAHLLWNVCLSRLDAGTCAAFYPLQPLVSALLGVLFLDEHFTAAFAVGGAVTVAGVAMCVTEKRGKSARGVVK